MVVGHPLDASRGENRPQMVIGQAPQLFQQKQAAGFADAWVRKTPLPCRH